MANNKLYIIDDETGEFFGLARSMGEGWHAWDLYEGGLVEKLNEFLQGRDMKASVGSSGNMKPTRLRLVTEAEIMRAEGGRGLTPG